MHKILIRPLKVEDANTSYQWRNDSEIWKYTGSKPNRIITADIEKDWLSEVLQRENEKRFAITADDIYIGNIQLTNITKDQAEYHIFIGDKNYWGKGIAQLATYQILHYAKEELKLKDVYLSVRKENANAINTYFKSSFEKTEEIDDWIKMKCKLDCLPTPMVSVFVMVYNHEKFLKECLDGILMQKCNFNFNIIVGEDCSIDNSRRILLEYQENFPGKFVLLLHNQNIGANANQQRLLESCNGKYIAMCEGDDYWIDPLKLQKQVDFLDKNPDYAICFHKIIYQYENGIKPFIKDIEIPETTEILDIIYNNYIPTLSVVFRNFHYYPKWMSTAYPGDWPLHILNATRGKIRMMENEMGVYRVHFGGVHSTTGGKPIESLATIKDLAKEMESLGKLKERDKLLDVYDTKKILTFVVTKNKFSQETKKTEKVKMLLKSRNLYFRILFFLPIVFPNNYYNIFEELIKLKKQS